MATTTLANVIGNANVFGKWVLERTKQLSGIDNSPIVQDDDELLEWVNTKGNLVWQGPKYDSLDRTAVEKILTEADSVLVGGAAPVAPLNITTHIEKAVRTYRANWWSASQLSKYLNLDQDDPAAMIRDDIAGYWAFRRQVMWLSVWIGVFADNDLAPGGSDTHTQFDLTLDRSNAGAYSAGTTNFTAENAIDAVNQMGDAEDDLGYIVTHSKVRSGMEKQDLLDTIKDSTGNRITVYRNRPLIVNDQMTKGAGAGVFHSYFMGAGCTRRAIGNVRKPIAISEHEEAANGGGQEIIWSRVCWCYHPKGYQFVGTPAAAGGVSNTELQAAANWSRSAKERKQVPVVRLITTEF